MRWLVSVPMYIWGLLTLPSVLIGIAAVLRRTSVWAVMLGFSSAVATAGAAESYYTIFVIKRFDEKFREAPGAALELALFGDAIIGFVGVLLFSAALAFFVRRNFVPKLSRLYLAWILGASYSTLPNVVYWSHVDLPNALFWMFVATFPVAAARLTVRKIGAENPASRSLTDGKLA